MSADRGNSLIEKTKAYLSKPENRKVAQTPNLPIISCMIFTVLSWLLVPESWLANTSELLAFGSVFTWAWLEIFQGLNVFRRAMGIIAMIVIICGKTSLIGG